MSSSTTMVLPSIAVPRPTDLTGLWQSTNMALQQMNRQFQQLTSSLNVTKNTVTTDGTSGGGSGLSVYPLIANSVGSTQLVDASIINSKIAANAVQTANILDSAITTLKIANAAVTNAQVAVNTITGGLTGNLASATITAYNIVAATITASQIAAATILGSNIAASTITGGNIAALTITASNIAANTITASQIAAGTIVGSNIAAGTITATLLNVSSLSAITANFGTMTAGTIQGNITFASTNRVLATDNVSFTSWQGPSGANTPGFYTQQSSSGGGFSAYGVGSGSPSIGLYRSAGTYGSPSNLGTNSTVASVFVQGYSSGYQTIGRFDWGISAGINNQYFRIQTLQSGTVSGNWVFNYDGKLYFLGTDVNSPNSTIYAVAPYVSDTLCNLYRASASTLKTDGNYQIGSSLTVFAYAVLNGVNYQSSPLSIATGSAQPNSIVLTYYRASSFANSAKILFKNDFWNDGNYGAAAIAGLDDGAAGGRLAFSVTADGSGSTGVPTEKMYLNNDGTLQWGSVSALAGEVLSGYILIKDLAGTTRKLAIIS